MNITMTTMYSSDLDLNITKIMYSSEFDPNSTVHNWHRFDCDLDCVVDKARKKKTSILRTLTFFMSIIGIVGILGNTLVIIVFSRTVRKRTSTYLVLTLAIIDLIACSVVIPGTLMKEWLFEIKSDIVCKIWELLKHFTIISSAMILAAIAFDRFLIVYKRIQDGNKYLTFAVILVAIVISMALGVPPMLGVGVYIESFNSQFINIKVCITNDQYITAEGLFLYWQTITGLFGALIVTIIIFYMLIFVMVYKHSKILRNSSTSQSNSQTKTINQSNTPKQGTSILPFIGLPPSQPQLTFRIKNNEKKPIAFFPITLTKIHNMFRRKRNKKSTEKDQVIAIRIIKHSASSASSLSQTETSFPRKNSKHDYAEQGTSKAGLEPAASTSRITGTSKIHSKFNEQKSTHNASVISTNQNQQKKSAHNATCCLTNQNQEQKSTHNASGCLTNQNRQQQIRNQSAHVKTTQVLCMITTVYIISFLPMFLITHEVLGKNEIIFYLYFINNAANPIIYSFMNRKFRQDICKMFQCKSNRIWTG